MHKKPHRDIYIYIKINKSLKKKLDTRQFILYKETEQKLSKASLVRPHKAKLIKLNDLKESEINPDNYLYNKYKLTLILLLYPALVTVVALCMNILVFKILFLIMCMHVHVFMGIHK